MKLLIFILLLTSCASYNQFRDITTDVEIPTQTYPASFTLTWKSVIQAIRDKYPTDLLDQESGVIKTKWVDNTVELNFSDSFGNSDKIKFARFKMTINVSKGFQLGREVSRVEVLKRQFIERGPLQGLAEEKSDFTLEKTLLYRIDRIIKIERELEKIDQAKQQAELEEF